MANNLQKLVYNLSVASPLLFTFSFVWYFQKQSWIIPIICTVVAVFLVISLWISFSYGKGKLAPIPIRTNEISPSDGWIAVYIISYILPFASMIIDDYNIFICAAIALVTILIAAFVNTSIPNPILFLLGYHFYSVDAENGISGYVLISKKNLRNKQNLKVVYRVFEFLLLDTEE